MAAEAQWPVFTVLCTALKATHTCLRGNRLQRTGNVKLLSYSRDTMCPLSALMSNNYTLKAQKVQLKLDVKVDASPTVGAYGVVLLHLLISPLQP